MVCFKESNKGNKMEIIVAIAVAWWAWNHFVNQILSDFVILNYQYVCLKSLHTGKNDFIQILNNFYKIGCSSVVIQSIY